MVKQKEVLDQGPFFHGTKAELQIGDLLQTQRISNYQNRKMNHIYFTGALDTAKWGAELSATLADEPAQEYIYIIEPIGAFENDPNVTDKKFPGNPTRSYRSKEPLRIVAKLATWERHSNHDIEQMLKGLAQLRKDGLDIIED
ncbi:NAD(+)--rifampin ADP-ribosyltransferase [Staphylococcus equorum]|uniref:NAD(+)--rifampin ADP-ribosyltransferase n=1 Tax=Staphylococcus equorum TaxID=246432 RepID=UPI0037DA5092